MSQTDRPADATLRGKYPLRKAKILKKTLSQSVFPVTLGFLGFVLLFLLKSALPVLLIGISLAITFALYYYNVLYFRSYHYDLTAEGLSIGKGVINVWNINIPVHKIQDIYIDQDFLDRIFGLFDLHLSTATNISAYQAHIDGVSEGDALALRRILLADITSSTPEAEREDEKAGYVIIPSQAGLLKIILSRLTGFILIPIFLFGGLGILLAVFAAPLAILLSYLDFKAMKYTLRKDGLLSHTGFFIPKESMLLYRNIQDVEEFESFWDRILGTSTLVIKTMTAASTVNANIAFVSKQDATAAKEEIRRRCRLSLDRQSRQDSGKGVNAEKYVETKATRTASDDKVVVSPYENRFVTNAHYANAASTAFLLIVFSVVLFFYLLGLPLPVFLLLSGLILLLWAGVVVMTYVSAAIYAISYSYELRSDSITVVQDFFSRTQRQIPFSKIQDIEKYASFSQSFTKLATLTVETGSKELVTSGRSGYIASRGVFNESIPSLTYENADRMRSFLIGKLGFNLQGLGEHVLSEVIRLHPSKPLKKTVSWALGGLLALFLCALLVFFLRMSYAIAAGALLVYLVLVSVKYLYEREYVKRYKYDISDDILVIRKGVFGHRELTIPFSRIQSIYVDRDILDLAFGLYDVYVSTVTGRSLLNAHIDGLSGENADAMVAILSEKISEKL